MMMWWGGRKEEDSGTSSSTTEQAPSTTGNAAAPAGTTPRQQQPSRLSKTTRSKKSNNNSHGPTTPGGRMLQRGVAAVYNTKSAASSAAAAAALQQQPPPQAQQQAPMVGGGEQQHLNPVVDLLHHHQPIHNMAETTLGVEISLSGGDRASTTHATAGGHAPQIELLDVRDDADHYASAVAAAAVQKYWSTVINVNELLAHRQKVYRTQLAVHPWPVMDGHEVVVSNHNMNNHHPSAAAAAAAPHKEALVDLYNVRTRRHRVPLFGVQPHSTQTFDDILFLLRSHLVTDETTAVKEELASVNKEIAALEEDRADLEKRGALLAAASGADAGGAPSSKMQSSSATATTTAATTDSLAPTTRAASSNSEWEVNRLLLAQAKKHLTAAQRAQLQDYRGVCLHVCLSNPKAQESILLRCGSKQSDKNGMHSKSPPGKNRRRSPNTLADSIISIRPDNCRDGGAAATIQHVAFLHSANASNNNSAPSSSNSTSSSGSDSGFFISRDSGKSYHWGHLPDRLFRRMKNAGLDPAHHSSEFLYLSTGPHESYYAEFRSGEVWWAASSDDEDFHSICSEWDVYRVAFGPCTLLQLPAAKLENETSATPSLPQQQPPPLKQHSCTSWIILGRDGRVAWKNIPARLHSCLQNRLPEEAMPAEVALGAADAYFCRFLDGTVDYCLPAAVASTCQNLERQGCNLMSMALHPDSSHEFIIRTTDVPSAASSSSQHPHRR